MKKLRVALVQMDSGLEIEKNLGRADQLLAGAEHVDLVALPEVFACRGSDADYRRSAQALDDSIIAWAAALAREKVAWILAGSFCERSGDKVFNTSVLLDRDGQIAATYRKIHLFEAFLDDGGRIREADAFDPGDTPVMADVDGWQTGLTICYDLRFPELFRSVSADGAHLFVVPANFTQRTGRDHWEVLLRARAIENQCFVVAPGQCGANRVTGVASYGNSMVIGPWGEILCRAGETEELLVAELDPQYLSQIRERIPVLKHRRLS